MAMASRAGCVASKCHTSTWGDGKMHGSLIPCARSRSVILVRPRISVTHVHAGTPVMQVSSDGVLNSRARNRKLTVIADVANQYSCQMRSRSSMRRRQASACTTSPDRVAHCSWASARSVAGNGASSSATVGSSMTCGAARAGRSDARPSVFSIGVAAALSEGRELFTTGFGIAILRGRVGERARGRARFSTGKAMTTAMVMTASGGKTTMSPPYNVLITGSTKGVGYALAKEFLRAGDNVIICSRSGDRVDEVCNEMKQEFGENRVWGKACNVKEGKDVEELASFAKNKLGYVDLWINNAGTNAYNPGFIVDATDKDLQEIVETNSLGVMVCCREAIRLMRGQARGGHIFNMDGAGADGNASPRFAAYGATKRGLAQFTKSLQAELKVLGVQNITVHNLSPGMVTTDLLMSGTNTPTAKFFVNSLAETPETVADFLVPRLRKVPQNGGNSTYIRYLTLPKAYTQILSRILFKARKDRFVSEE